jgi:hypothetical protein
MSATRRTAAVATLYLLTACGGPKQEAGAPADTAAPAAAPAAAPTDTVAKADTATRSDSGTAAASAAKPASKPSATPAAKPAARPTAKPAAKPAPKPTQQAAADTTSAKAGGSTSDTATQAAAADAPLRDAYHQAPRDTVSQAVYDGWKQFNLNCARCHGEDVTGTTIAPHLILSLKPDGPINTKELFVSTVCGGRPAKGMPAWCALGLGMDKIQDIYLYVKGRSDAKIAPGRPAVKSEG